jgi:hypothetical protein
MNMAAQPLHIACLQESKLEGVHASKASSFLPPGLSSYSFVPSRGASAGIITAWDPRFLHHVTDNPLEFSLTSSFELAADGMRFSITNVYAPCDGARRDDFLAELRSLAGLGADPWLIVGISTLLAALGTGTTTTSMCAPRML